MELLQQFKHYLLSRKDKPAKATVKNYLADIRKFISWYELNFKMPFDPTQITHKTIELYKTSFSIASDAILSPTSYVLHPNQSSPRSVERYLSSLRKFFQFLEAEKLIDTTPFILHPTSYILHPKDPWLLKDFKNYLYTSGRSRLTMKNYILDIRQFLNWAREVLKDPSQPAAADTALLSIIDSPLLEEYRNRLLYQANMSPVSINRKLSSLRQYLAWMHEKGLAKESIDIASTPEPHSPQVPPPPLFTLPIHPPLTSPPTQALSRIPPLRLLQKSLRLSSLLLDLLMIVPVTTLIEKCAYISWKIRGARVFQPIETIIQKQYPGLSQKDNPNDSSKNPGSQIVISDNTPAFLKSLLRFSNLRNAPGIHNLPKSLYAPLKISTKGLPIQKKIYLILRHKRPKWYKKYHSYALVHYLHFAVLIIIMTALGFSFYSAFFADPAQKAPVLAAVPASPPRLLAFQGKLSDAQNNPITAETDLRFGIYDHPTASGAAQLWQEVQTVTPDQDGKFSVLLGKNTPISQSLFTQNSGLYLGISIGTDSELTPRQQLATVTAAANSQTLQGLSPITQKDAGTSNVVLALDSAGNLTIGGRATPTFQASGGEFTLSGKTLVLNTTAGSGTNVQISPDGAGLIDLQKPLTNTSNNNNIPSALGAVEIDDRLAILATSSGQSAFTLNQNSTGPLISASTSGTAMFTLGNTGEGMFAGDLTINGSSLTTQNTTFNLLNNNAINLNLGGSATALSLGASSGTTMINNTILARGGITIPADRSLLVAGTIASNLTPSLNAVYDLGSPSNYWNNLYVNNLYASSSATAFGFWQRNNNAVSPGNPADDLIIGQTASNSGVFRIFAHNSTAPVASISANTSYAALAVSNQGSGALFTASASGTTKFVITQSGKVGIGTSDPAATLDLAGGTMQGAGLSADCSAAGKTLQWSSQTKQFSCATTSQVPSGDPGGADYAEMYFTNDKSIAAGDVISIDGSLPAGMQKTQSAYDKNVLGVISTDPAQIIGNNSTQGSPLPVALSGRVPVKVSTENGPIHIGDSLTASSLPGIAMKATQPGEIIGKSLENFNCSPSPTPPTPPISLTGASCRGKIMLFVSRSWYDPDVYLTGTGDLNIVASQSGQILLLDNTGSLITRIAAFAEAAIANIRAGYVQAQALTVAGFIQAREITTNSLTVASGNITIGTQSLHDYIASMIKNQLDIGNLKLEIGNSFKTDIISPLASGSAIALSLDRSRLTIHADNTASSAAVAVIDNQGNASFSGQLTSNSLQTNDATVSDTLHVHNLIADNLKSSSTSATYITNINNIYNSISTSSATLTPPTSLTTLSASSSASLSASSSALAASPSASLRSLTSPTSLTDISSYSDLASMSATLAYTPTLSTDFARFNHGFMSYGPASLSDTSVTGQLSVDASFIISNNAINTLGSELQLQPLRQADLSIMAGLVTINTDGDLSVAGSATFAKDVTVKGTLAANILAPIPGSDLIIKLPPSPSSLTPPTPPSSLTVLSASDSAILKVNQLGDVVASGAGTFSRLAAGAFNVVRSVQADTSLTETVASSSAGTAVITQNETERTIYSPYVTKDSLIYLTATSDTQGITPYIARQTVADPTQNTQGSFTIEIPYPLTRNITLNWWIVN